MTTQTRNLKKHLRVRWSPNDNGLIGKRSLPIIASVILSNMTTSDTIFDRVEWAYWCTKSMFMRYNVKILRDLHLIRAEQKCVMFEISIRMMCWTTVLTRMEVAVLVNCKKGSLLLYGLISSECPLKNFHVMGRDAFTCPKNESIIKGSSDLQCDFCGTWL